MLADDRRRMSGWSRRWWTAAALTAWLSSVVTFGIDFVVEPSTRLIGAAVAVRAVEHDAVRARSGVVAVAPGSHRRSQAGARADRAAACRAGRCWSSRSSRCRSRWSPPAGCSRAPRSTPPAADAGYPLERQIVVGLDPSLAGYDEARTRAAYAAVLERVRALPGVERASFASTVAFGDMQMGGRVRVVGGRDGCRRLVRHHRRRLFRDAGPARAARPRVHARAEEQRGSPAPGALIDARLARSCSATPIRSAGAADLRIRAQPIAPQTTRWSAIAPPMRHDLFESPPSRTSTSPTVAFQHDDDAPRAHRAGVPDAAMLGDDSPRAAARSIRACRSSRRGR